MNRYERLLEIENKYNLLDFTLNNIYIWQVMRENIFYKLDSKSSKKNKRVSLKCILKSFILNNPLIKLSKKDDLFFGYYSRMKLIDEKYQDMFFFELMKKSNSYQYYGYRESFTQLNMDNSLDYDVVLYISKIMKKFSKLKLLEEEYNFIKNIEQEIYKSIDLDLDLTKLIKETYNEFKLVGLFYKFIFYFKKPKRVYLINSGLFMPIIKVAKDLNISVIELQHGVIYKGQPNYNYSDQKKAKYFPDKFYYFGRFWKDKFPLSMAKNYIYGSDYLNYELKQQKTKKKINKSILITSADSSVDIYLVDYLLANIKYLTNYKIYYKLHPRDYKKQNKELNRLLLYENIEIIRDEQSTYELFAVCENHLSVGSTTIYEGLFFKCRTFILQESDLFDVTKEINDTDFIEIVNKKDLLINFLNNKQELNTTLLKEIYRIKG
ncbi:hypothetical protein ACN9JU_00720 [Aliarcobacter butzleri]|uniref:hypothetical protein n=1 Tax=Aliarcobacter butzleri TaxID=28197 RepID=UPI003B2236DE